MGMPTERTWKDLINVSIRGRWLRHSIRALSPCVICHHRAMADDDVVRPGDKFNAAVKSGSFDWPRRLPNGLIGGGGGARGGGAKKVAHAPVCCTYNIITPHGACRQLLSRVLFRARAPINIRWRWATILPRDELPVVSESGQYFGPIVIKLWFPFQKQLRNRNRNSRVNLTLHKREVFFFMHN